MTTRSDVRFMADGGIELGAWLFSPGERQATQPCDYDGTWLCGREGAWHR